MKTFRAALVAAVVAGAVLTQASPPANAQSSREEAEEALKEGVAQILRALETLFASIPQYEAPEVLENGDIIIRRKHPKQRPEPEPSPPDVDETRT